MTRRALASLDAERSRSRTPLRSVHLGLQVDREGRILRSRPFSTEPFAIGDAEVVGEYAADLFVDDDALSARALLHRAARGDTMDRGAVLRMRRVDGEELLVRVSAYVADDAINVRIRECNATEKSDFHMSSAVRARVDPLTGLPNRRLFLERSDAALQSGPQTLVLVDVDRFRHFVTALGTRAADRILVETGDRLVSSVGATGVVGLAAGQFAVLVPGRSTPLATTSLIAQIRQAIGTPFTVDGDAITLSACLGLAASTSDSETLFADAEVALAQAKSVGPAHDAIFDPEFRRRVLRNVAVQGELSRAVADQELRLDYQPIVALATDAIVGYEALVRWQHPVRGKLAPRDFLEIAQMSHAGAAIDDWVLTEACRQGALWARTGQPTTICINAAPERFAVDGYVEQIEHALSSSGLDPSLLVIEITEGSMLVEVDAARTTLAALKVLGVRVALDDYGTGCSSLADVAALEVDELKIDMSFVAGLGADRARTAIVHAIVGLGHALGITVVAEGIESAAQAFALRSLGCEFGQGFHFGYPGRGPALMQRTT